MQLPLHELIGIILHNYHYVCSHLDNYPSLSHALSQCPNNLLLRHYNVIHTPDNILRSRQCAINDLLHLRYTMKIEEILGYSAEDIKAWDDETLIRNCMEHFVYTRPETNVPVVVKEKAAKKIKSAPVEYIQDENGNFVEAPKAIVKQLSNTEKEKLAAQEMLKKLLTPENLAVFQNLNKNK